jgi:hypothetical protein
MNIFGYYTEENQTVPDFDPGLDVVCPVCMCPLTAPMVTTSLMRSKDGRSYFYRMHKKCSDNTVEVERIESSLIDSIKN